MSALPSQNPERRRLLKERVRRIADQNKSLMDQIISALDIAEKPADEDKPKGEKDGSDRE